MTIDPNRTTPASDSSYQERLTDKYLSLLDFSLELSRFSALVFAAYGRCPLSHFRTTDLIDRRNPACLVPPHFAEKLLHAPYDIIVIEQVLGYLYDDEAALRELLPYRSDKTLFLVTEHEEPAQAHTLPTDKWNLRRLYGKDLPARLAKALGLRYVASQTLFDRPFSYQKATFHLAGNNMAVFDAVFHPKFVQLSGGIARYYDFTSPDASDGVTLPEPRKQPQQVLFSSDYRTKNPYQTLLYGDTALAAPGSLDQALQQQAAPGFTGTVILHIHWLEALFPAVTDASLPFEEQCRNFLSLMSRFKQAGGKVVWTVHNLTPHEAQATGNMRLLLAHMAEQADVILVHAPPGDAHEAELLGKYSDKIQVIAHGNYIGAYPAAPSPEQARHNFSFAPHETVFLFLGQLRPYKGIEDLLRAFSMLVEEEPRSRLLIAGWAKDSDYQAELENLAADIPGVTLDLRFIPDEELGRYFAASDVVVLPFTRILNSGSALLALSQARPVIAPKIGNLGYLLGPCGEPLLYDPLEPDGLLQRMRFAAKLRAEELTRLQEKAYERSLDFPWNASRSKLNALYADLFFSKLRQKRQSSIADSSFFLSPPRLKRSSHSRLAVVVCHYDNLKDTFACLDSLNDQSEVDFDGYVVSNNEDILAFSLLRERFLTWTCIQSPGNIGFAAGNNQVLELLRDKDHDYIWLVNPDIVLPPGALCQLLRQADAHPEASIFGSYILSANGTLWFGGGQVLLEQGLQATHLHYGIPAQNAPQHSFFCDYITGASLLFRKKLLDDVGLLPEDLFLYFEETQWCLEAARLGHKALVFPEPLLVHKRRSEQNGAPGLHYLYYYTRNLLLSCQKYAPDNLHDCLRKHRETLVQSWLRKIKTNCPDRLQDALACIDLGIADGLAGKTGVLDIETHLLRKYPPWQNRD
ncbi:glycosyltransferase [Desulfovibrio sp. OttesenSCG-928-F20]|nr:glycosyltransferase [Desulfovibrio sp. OttesenSCG-928-M16]MDL2290663.1 glycosyltransferase [Desulfovibrio sp. OttesenSCG-928-F20]